VGGKVVQSLDGLKVSIALRPADGDALSHGVAEDVPQAVVVAVVQVVLAQGVDPFGAVGMAADALG
jgi:hypothetical protein